MYSEGLTYDELNMASKYHYNKLLKAAISGDERALQQLIIRFESKAREVYRYLQDVLPQDIEEEDIIQYVSEIIVGAVYYYKLNKQDISSVIFIQLIMFKLVSILNNIYTRTLNVNNYHIKDSYGVRLHMLKKRFARINDILEQYKYIQYHTSKKDIWQDVYTAEINDIINTQLKNLKPIQSIVINEYFLQGKTLQEIGNILGCTRENVRQHITKAIHTLQIRLKKILAEQKDI